MNEGETVIREFRELKFTVVATRLYSHSINYTVYRHAGISYENDEVLYLKAGEVCNIPCDTLKEASIFVNGAVKWDGCSNWHFDEQDFVMIHECTREGLLRIGEILAKCWDLTRELLPVWGGEKWEA